jgi:hypothetical protein
VQQVRWVQNANTAGWLAPVLQGCGGAARWVHGGVPEGKGGQTGCSNAHAPAPAPRGWRQSERVYRTPQDMQSSSVVVRELWHRPPHLCSREQKEQRGQRLHEHHRGDLRGGQV